MSRTKRIPLSGALRITGRRVDLRHIHHPLLVVAASHDNIVPPRAAQALMQAVSSQDDVRSVLRKTRVCRAHGDADYLQQTALLHAVAQDMARDAQKLCSLDLIVSGADEGLADQVFFHAVVGFPRIRRQGMFETDGKRVMR